MVLVVALLLSILAPPGAARRYFRDLAENNRSSTVPLAAPRGALLDRNGRILVENRASFNVMLTPEHAEDSTAHRAPGPALAWARPRSANGWRGARRSGPWWSKADASLADVAAIEARRLELPEARVDVVPLRSYPLAAAAAHTLGRVGEVTDRSSSSPSSRACAPGDLVGQAGVELQYNREPDGPGRPRRVIVNSRGVEVAEAEREPPGTARA